MKWLAYIGTISYGMYLLHGFVPWLGEAAGLPLPDHGFVRFVVLTAATTVLAAASWRFFEGPLNSLKDRFPYAKSKTIQLEAQTPMPIAL